MSTLIVMIGAVVLTLLAELANAKRVYARQVSNSRGRI